MSNTSVVETIAERIEQELARVRAARPALASRVSRAENILVTHLSCRRQRLIRIRVRDGRPRFLVSGSKGAVYVVNPGDWSCTCPDHHRHGKGCKHSIACWALWRASARLATTRVGSRRCGAGPKITRHVTELASMTVRESSAPPSSYEERACSRYLDGRTYDGQAGSWVACESCGGSGRALLFVYPKAKETTACSGYSERFRRGELEEVTEEHKSLTWFPGDLLCPGCLRAHGGIS